MPAATMPASSASFIQSLESEFALHAPTVDRSFPFGTAGFRSVGADMRHVMHRSGLLAVLFSCKLDNKATGICITGSHNLAQDNGVKFMDANGGLAEEFEADAAEFVNAKKPVDAFVQLCNKYSINFLDSSVFSNCCIYCGRDTRPSSPTLYGYVKAAVEFLGAQMFDLGVVTTPQVHFAVQTANQRNLRDVVSLQEYYKHFSDRFAEFLQLCSVAGCAKNRHLPERLVCDGGNGVGAIRVSEFNRVLKNCINVDLEVRNDGTMEGDELNCGCGTEYVQKEMQAPKGFGLQDPMYLRCCSFDGDADRLVYHTTDATGKLILVDGDKIGCLYGMAIAKLLEDIIQNCPDAPAAPLRLASVQTAYANGASIKFYAKLGSRLQSSSHSQVTFEVSCVKTGVKNLHRKAIEFDIAIYFESNGHGTVMTNMKRVENWARERGADQTLAFKRLRCFLNIFNQATGDAMADVLAVEAALKYLEMSFMEWIRIYSDIPCIQRKVRLPRSVLDTLKPHPDHEQWLLQPANLQQRVDSAVAVYADARAFIRPSGTENVCRLYVEAATQDTAQKLCHDLESLIREMFP